MAKIDDVANEFYNDLSNAEETALRRMAVAHSRTLDALAEQFMVVNAKIEADAALGLDSGAYVLQQQRLASLVTQAAHEYTIYGEQVGLHISQLQQHSVDIAQSFVPQAIGAQDESFAAATFARLPKSAITQFVGYLGDGSPLRDLTQSFGTLASKQLNATLLAGIGAGLNPRVVARQMLQTAGDIGKARAETIARTEMMRTFRESARRTMQKNSGVVKGWRWWSALDKRTCPVCYAMHGQEFPLSESMATHPNCRCMQMPITYTFKQLGINANESAALDSLSIPGRDHFAQLDEPTQRLILGKGGFTAWKNGLITLDDFVLNTYSPAWGYGRTTKSLREIVGSDNARLLSQGKIPANFKPTGTVFKGVDIGDPFITRRSKIQNLVEDGLMSDADGAGFLAAIDAGKFSTLDELDIAIQANKDAIYAHAKSVFDEAVALGIEDAAAADAFLEDFANGQLKVADLETAIATEQSAIEAEKIKLQQAAQLALDNAKASLKLELDKAKLFGNVDDFEYQQYLDDIANGNLSVVEYNNIEISLAHDNKVNNPFEIVLNLAESAKNQGFITVTDFQGIEALMKNQLATLQETQAIKDGLELAIKQNSPMYSAATEAPQSYAQLTSMYSNKKLTYTEYNNILLDVSNGKYTPSSFKTFVDDLEIQKANVVTKSSQQLLSELDLTYYTDVEKANFKYQYQTKQIDKQQMQDILNAAPSTPPTPPVLTQPNVQLAYTDKFKAQDAIYDLAGQNKITYKELDAWNNKMFSIGQGGYTEQQFINEVEQFVKTFNPPATSGTMVHTASDGLNELSKLVKSNIIDVADYNSFITKYYNIGKGSYTEADFVKDVNTVLSNVQQVIPTIPPPVSVGTYVPPVYKPTLPTIPPSKTVSLLTKSDVYTYAQNEYYAGNITYKEWNAIRSKSWDIGSYVNGKVYNEADYIKWAEKKLNVNQSNLAKKALPYKKHLNELDDLISQGLITQAEKDQIIDLYQAGKFKNADIESYITQTKAAAQYQAAGGGTYGATHPVFSTLNDPFDVKNYNWGYSNYRSNVSHIEVKAWRQSVSHQAFQVVQDYTGGDYVAINNHLRGISKSSRIAAREQHIREAFASPHARLSQDVVSVRGTKVPLNSPWATTPIGGTVEDLGILSTSVDTNGAWNANPSRANHVGLELTIMSPVGTNAIYTESFSNHPGEKELTFPPGAKFMVMGRKERTYGPSKIVSLVVQALP